MIFRHQRLERELEWKSTRHLNELVIESPSFFRAVLHDLNASNENRGSSFSRNGQALNFGQAVDVIYNPTKLDFNNRRAIAALLKLLVKTSLSEDFYLSTNRLKAKIINYLDSVVDAENFEFEVAADDFAIDSLAKAVNIHIMGDEDDFVEMVTDYLSMMTDLGGVKLFIFINLRSMLTDEELNRLRHNLDNHQIDVLLIENQARARIGGVDRILVDADECEI